MSLKLGDTTSEDGFFKFKDVNKLQEIIMQFIHQWVRVEKTPVPRVEIIKHLESMGVNDRTTENALNALLRKGYLRRISVTLANIGKSGSAYIQLRSL